MAYSRHDMGGGSGNYQRLNAFGQPFTGRKIRGVGMAWSALSSKERSDYGSQSNFAAEKLAEHEMQMGARAQQSAQQAAEMGRAKAQASVGPPAPAKRPGMLVPSVGGGSKWMTGEELTAQEEARKKQRKATALGTPGSSNFVGPLQYYPQQKADLDRKFSRIRVNAERHRETEEKGAGAKFHNRSAKWGDEIRASIAADEQDELAKKEGLW